MDSRLRIAGLAGLSGVAGSYAVTGYSRRFVLAPIDAVVVRASPGSLVAWMITNVGEQAHLLHVGLSFAIAVALLGTAGVIGYVAAQKLGGRRWLGGAVLAGVFAWGVTFVITAEPLLAIGGAVPVALVTAVETVSLSSASQSRDTSGRRKALSSVGTLLFAALAGWIGWSRSISQAERANPQRQGTTSPEVTRLLERADSQELDFASEDLPGLVSPIEEFYNVDIAEFDPEIASADWSFTLTGDVENDLTVTFEQLQQRPVEHRYVTLRCVGESLNGEKLDTAVWTGTALKPLLEAADPDGACGCAMLRAEDDYFVQFPVEALEDSLLVWGMNGKPLPQSHGHPIRVLVPGHWGETNVKWLSEIELLEEPMDGYWEQRGWHGTGPVNTVAKLWDVTQLDGDRIEVGGHAYAGTRGIDAVEASTDGGDTWETAALSEPLPGEDVWRQWRYVYEATEPHEVVVRAIDGEGTTQPEDRAEAFPSGATGWVSKRVSP